MSDVVLEADKLSKFFRHDWTYSRRTVLQEVSFSVTRGQAFGFVGPNGAGKTTTIKILLDLVRPSSGAVRLFGLSPHERKVREKIGFLPERPYLYDHLTATETLHLYGGLLGLGGAHLGRRHALGADAAGATIAGARFGFHSRGKVMPNGASWSRVLVLAHRTG